MKKKKNSRDLPEVGRFSRNQKKKEPLYGEIYQLRLKRIRAREPRFGIVSAPALMQVRDPVLRGAPRVTAAWVEDGPELPDCTELQVRSLPLTEMKNQ